MTNFITVRRVREILNVESNDTVYSLIKSGDLTAFKSGKGGKTSKWMIHKDSLEEYIKRSTKRTLQDVGT